MLKLVLIGTVVACVSALYHPINEDMATEIRKNTKNWFPMEVSQNPLKDASHLHILSLMGTKRADPLRSYTSSMENAPVTGVPDNFDSRDKFKACVHPIRNQAKCGSCWAFGSSEALSDRFCIASQGKIDVVLSPEDLVSCDTDNYGCQGGYLNKAWDYLEKTGVVADSCFNYTAGNGTAPQCITNTCTDPSVTFKKYKCQAKSVVEETTPNGIKQEIFTNGPMETAFDVYEDFMHYAGGVYHHVTGKFLGGHAIKVLGWGTDKDSGLNYWLCANSWGEAWGEQGFFRIKQGECGIDDAVYACQPDVSAALF